MSEFKVGDRAVAKVGRNEINVEILAVEEKSYLVRNNAGKEFHAVRLTALPDAEPEIINEDDAPNPALECAMQKPDTMRQLSYLAKVDENDLTPSSTKKFFTSQFIKDYNRCMQVREYWQEQYRKKKGYQGN